MTTNFRVAVAQLARSNTSPQYLDVVWGQYAHCGTEHLRLGVERGEITSILQSELYSMHGFPVRASSTSMSGSHERRSSWTLRGAEERANAFIENRRRLRGAEDPFNFLAPVFGVRVEDHT